jgi:hypothetical protein
MSVVKISANIIHWPPVCACCCARADTKHKVAAVREAPIIAQLEEEYEMLTPPRRLYVASVAALGVEISFCFVLAIFIHNAIAWIQIAVCLFFLIGSVVGLLFVLPYTARLDRSSNARRTKAFQGRLRDLEREIDEIAVDYLGWYGTVHTFTFASRSFRDEFCRYNVGKILD